jgi:hypothetical protein
MNSASRTIRKTSAKNKHASLYKLAFQYRYHAPRYQDPKTSRWISADPALSSYLPTAGGDNSSLPGMGGIYNTVNANLYHYGANNPIVYLDPDGRQSRGTTRVPLSQRSNNMPRTNLSPEAHAAGQYMANHAAETQVYSDALEESFYALSNENSLMRLIDDIFLGSKHRKAAASFTFKVFDGFIKTKIQTADLMLSSGAIKPGENGRFSVEDAELFVNNVNDTMLQNYSDQSELCPYEGSVLIPQMTTVEALLYLNKEKSAQELTLNR